MNGEVEDSLKTFDELAVEYSKQPGFKKLAADEKPFFDMFTNRLSDKLADKINGKHGKFELVYIGSEKLTKLYKKMKENAPECKLTALLSFILCKAVKKILTKYDVNEMPVDNFQLAVLSSLRDKFKIKNSQMGVYSYVVMCRVEDDLENCDFWKCAQRFSLLIHNFVKHNEDIPDSNASTTFFDMIDNDFDFTVCQNTNCSFSNIGIMKNTSNEAIKIDQHYVMVPCMDKRFGALFHNGLSTVDNNLCWSLCYNQKFFKTEFIRDVKDAILDEIEKLSV